MVAMILNDELIKAGEQLLKQLDESAVKVDAALWLYSPEVETWKLLLSLPGFIAQGPTAAYRKVQKALSALPEEVGISLNDVSIADPNNPLFHLLKKAIGTLRGNKAVRFTKNVVNGRLIDDALIYRLT